MEEAKGNWIEELPNVLWAYRTTPKKGIGESPFCLCFGVESLVPAEIGIPSPKIAEFNAVENEQLMQDELLFLEGIRGSITQRDDL